jgi:hypothetical protein
MSSGQAKRDRVGLVGALLVIVGLAMWGVYAVERYILHMPVTDRDFMPYHLATVLPGMLLWQHRLLTDAVKRLRARGSK